MIGQNERLVRGVQARCEIEATSQMIRLDYSDCIKIDASSEAIWQAMTDAELGRIWRGADFSTDWQAGSPIDITESIGSKPAGGKGRVLRADRPACLTYEFLLRLSGLPDVAENYSRVTITLTPMADGIELHVIHSVPPSPIRHVKGVEIGADSGFKHVEFYWRSALPVLRDLVEGRDSWALRAARDAWSDGASV